MKESGTVFDRLLARAAENPDAPAILAPGRRTLSYRSLADQIERTAAQLNRFGWGRGDRIAVLLPNGAEAISAILSVSAAAVCVPINAALTSQEITQLLTRFKVATVVTRTDTVPHAAEAAESAGIELIQAHSEPAEPAGVFTLSMRGAAGKAPAESSTPTLSDLALAAPTSGTTSACKIIPLTHASILAFGERIHRYLGLTPGDRCLNLMPASHSACLMLSIAIVLSGGGAILPEEVLVHRFFAWMDEFQPTFCAAAPPIFEMLVPEARRNGEVLARTPLRFLFTGGAPLSPHGVEAVENTFGVPLQNSYGATECGGISLLPLPPAVRKPGSAGIAVEGVEIRTDEGEVLVRAPGIFAGYEDDAAATASAFRNGWYRTGDRGFVDTDGYLFLTGRLNELINRGGEKIAPAEIEQVLLLHPQVARAAVFPVPHPQLGEDIAAAVVLREPVPSDVLSAFAARQLPEFKRPRVILTVPEIPDWETGKIRRRNLAVVFVDELAKALQAAQSDYVAPRNAIEEKLTEVWEEALGQTGIGVEDNFFSRGGHSLQAAQIYARVCASFDIELPATLLLEHPTIARQARMVEAAPKSGPGGLPSLIRRECSVAPLTSAQKRLWHFCRHFQSPVYHFTRLFGIEGELDVSRLQRALQSMVRRHESLRTVFRETNGELLQEVQPAAEIELSTVDLPRPSVDQWVEEATFGDMNLSVGPVFQARLVRTGERSYILFLLWHHIISDLASAEIFDRELSRLYAGEELPDQLIGFGDYAAWEAERPRPVEREEFWRAELAGAPSLIPLPWDRGRPTQPEFAGGLHVLEVDDELSGLLRGYAATRQVTPFSVFLAAWAALLSRYSGESDLTIGIPVSDRDLPQLGGLIGYFVNMIPVRLQVDPGELFPALVRRCTDRYRRCLENALPFDAILEAVRPERDLAWSPLFQVALNYLRESGGGIQIGGAATHRIPFHNGTSMFDLTLTVSDRPHGFQLSLEYSSALFDPETIQRMGGHLLRILQFAIGVEKTPVGSLSLLNAEERQDLLFERNATFQPLDDCETLVSRFEHQAAANPDKIALRAGDDTWTYQRLNAYADRVCGALREAGVRPGDQIAVTAERTPEISGALIGVAKSGAAWVPIDPRWPEARATFAISDSAAKLAIDSAWLNRMPGGEGRSEIATLSGDSLAYVIYTSGSTGKPKGVAITHRCLMNFLAAMEREPGLSRHDTLLSVTPLTFDISLNELFLPLICGATVVLPDLETVVDARAVRGLLEMHDVTVMQATPMMWRSLIAAGWKGSSRLRAWCGGETMPPELAEVLLKFTLELWNLYGPTETTIWSTAHRVVAGEAPVPIGLPIANTQCYVLDAGLAPLPPGLAGELYIAGEGVSPGYVGDARKESNRFLANPFVPGGMMYRTGDVVRWSSGGRLVFLRRTDTQVKLRGHRIELAEVETAMAGIPGVEACVVAVRGEALAAWLVCGAEVPWSPTHMRAILRAALPGYMVPSLWIRMKSLPVNSNGKIDRNNLPMPEGDSIDDQQTGTVIDPVEYRLVNIWKTLLGQRNIAAADNFFELGGHSLLFTDLLLNIEREFGKKLSPSLMFSAPTVAALAAEVRSADLSMSNVSVVSVQMGGTLPPFLCVNAMPGMRGLARRLGADLPFLSLYLPDFPGRSVERGAAQIVETLLAIQPAGPYRLGGWCAAGVIAFEVARQLRARGNEVALVVLFDSYNPAASGHVRFVSNRIRYHWGKALTGDLGDGVRYLGARLLGAAVQARRAMGKTAHKAFEPAGALPGRLPPELEAEIAVQSYRPCAYDGRVVLFRCLDRPRAYEVDPAAGWANVAPGLEIVAVPGDHVGMFAEPHVAILAQSLGECLRKSSMPGSMPGHSSTA